MNENDRIGNRRSNEGPGDPWTVLGVSADAGDEEIRAVYLTGCSAASADERPRLDEAYRRIRTEADRVRTRLLGPAVPERLEELAAEIRPRPRYAGPGVWLAALDRLRRKRESDRRDAHPE